MSYHPRNAEGDVEVQCNPYSNRYHQSAYEAIIIIIIIVSPHYVICIDVLEKHSKREKASKTLEGKESVYMPIFWKKRGDGGGLQHNFCPVKCVSLAIDDQIICILLVKIVMVMMIRRNDEWNDDIVK